MEQHIIPFNQGIHLTPSAAEDGQLSDCINLIPKDGTLRNIPTLHDTGITIDGSHTLAYIHHVGTQTNYITKKVVTDGSTTPHTTTTTLYLHPDASHPILTLIGKDIYQITSIGNTLLVLTSEGIHYLLWKATNNGEYIHLGTHLPEMSMQLSLGNPTTVSSTKREIDPDFEPSTFIHHAADADGIIKNVVGFEDGYQKSFNDAIFGEVNRIVNEEITKEGRFASSFYVRYAYRLYDGSLVMHSAPIFINIEQQVSVYASEEGDYNAMQDDWDYDTRSMSIVKWTNDDHTVTDPEIRLEAEWNFSVNYYNLLYQIKSNINDIKDWSDIITSIDIFISQPFYLYDQSGKIDEVRHEINTNTHIETVYVDMPLVEKQGENIENCSQFYYVKSIPVNEIDNAAHDLDVKGYLEALAAREQMTDDYDSHDTLIPKYSFVYNQRLNIASIEKNIFRGFTANQLSIPTGGSDTIQIYIIYHTPQGEMTFAFDEVTNVNFPDTWRYYTPNSYPATMVVYKTTGGVTTKQSVELKRHTYLNGSYAVIEKSNFDADSGSRPTASSHTLSLPNKLYTSEINNPFFFPVSGINTVGVGEIKGICAAVKALSTGQFGQFPLYVFTTDGIWALEVASDGTYSVKQPVTRDVVSNDNSITQTDTAVLYVTKRGLHIIYGSETKLLTEALEAHTEDSLFTTTSEQGKINIDTATAGFPEITSSVLATVSLLSQLQTCSISYDGINHIAHIYPAPSQTQPSTHYILNLDTMEWTRTTQPIPDAFIDGYPNATLQIGTSLYQYALASYANTSLQQGFLLTRETAVGEPLAHKILQDMRILKHFYSVTTTGAKVRIIPLISNDRRNWYQLTSLKGHSAIWYRFAVFTKIANSDILEALALITAPRRTNKLR